MLIRFEAGNYRSIAENIELSMVAVDRDRDGAREAMRWFDEVHNQPTLFGDDEYGWSGMGRREQALALLRLADLGIEDIIIDAQEVALAGSAEPRTQHRLRLVHRTDGHSAPLDFSAESEGTRTWFHLIGPVPTALRVGSVVVFDELVGSVRAAPGGSDCSAAGTRTDWLMAGGTASTRSTATQAHHGVNTSLNLELHPEQGVPESRSRTTTLPPACTTS
ncbi:AAA family ATPase [Micromonospora sp. CPCC 206060]|uniref:AAA family ATPase n=1 Tax=Micromonospora sp. CPCC 206060 TaxID=3122406 RepID=UPI002FF3E72F